MLVATSAMVGRICPPGGDRVRVSGNLGATTVAPVAPVVTSLYDDWIKSKYVASGITLPLSNRVSDFVRFRNCAKLLLSQFVEFLPH